MVAGVLKPQDHRGTDPDTAQETTAMLLLHFPVIPDGDGNTVVWPEIQIVVCVPFRVQGRLAHLRGVRLTVTSTIHVVTAATTGTATVN